MAFSTALRRAASITTGIAIRASGSSRNYHSALLPSLPLRGILSRELRGARANPIPAFAPFSSLTKKSASDADLVRVIDSEIKYTEESDDQNRIDEIPKGFPFEIQDEQGTGVVTLKRNFHGENIEVLVSMPSLVTGDEPGDDKDDDEDDDDSQEKGAQSSIPLTVTVSKGDGASLEFCCTAFPDEVTIESMSVRENKGSEEEEIAYEGPDFNDLDENLQKAFHKYLEIRGISAITTNFLHEYMINKDSREYLLWLKDLKQFVEK